MSHWDLVARCLRHKVSDKSMLVRRWAMKGLESMLFQNPFGPNLVLEFWKRLLDEWEAVLEARAPAEDKDASSGMPFARPVVNCLFESTSFPCSNSNYKSTKHPPYIANALGRIPC
jgi:hypothetical protein